MMPIIIVVAVVILGAGAYLVLGNRSVNAPSDDTSSSSTTSSEEETVAEKFTGTLKEAVALGVGMKCTYNVEGNEYAGYVKGENYRGSMKNVEGQVGEVIVKDNCMWTWSEDQVQGVKMCFEETEAAETESVSIWDREEVGAAAEVAYSCMPYAVSDSQFTPPSDVQFMDMESIMEGYGY